MKTSPFWDCKFCTNIYNGCKKCNTNNSFFWGCRSFALYIYNKIKCDCYGKILELQISKDCTKCKGQGFFVHINSSHFLNISNLVAEQHKIQIKELSETYSIIEDEKQSIKNMLSSSLISDESKEHELRGDTSILKCNCEKGCKICKNQGFIVIVNDYAFNKNCEIIKEYSEKKYFVIYKSEWDKL